MKAKQCRLLRRIKKICQKNRTKNFIHKKSVGYKILAAIDQQIIVGAGPFIMNAIDNCLEIINGKHRKNRISTVDYKQVINEDCGILEVGNNLCIRQGQYSRLVVAWWTDTENKKYLRIIADRVQKHIFPGNPPALTSFGIHPYNIVFSTMDGDPWHCISCRKKLGVGEGVYVDKSFFCPSCKYQSEFGLIPAVGTLGKKKKKWIKKKSKSCLTPLVRRIYPYL